MLTYTHTTMSLAYPASSEGIWTLLTEESMSDQEKRNLHAMFLSKQWTVDQVKRYLVIYAELREYLSKYRVDQRSRMRAGFLNCEDVEQYILSGEGDWTEIMKKGIAAAYNRNTNSPFVPVPSTTYIAANPIEPTAPTPTDAGPDPSTPDVSPEEHNSALCGGKFGGINFANLQL